MSVSPDNLEMMMSMTIVWTAKCKFLFNGLMTEEDQVGLFLVGCLICGILGAISVALPTFRQKLVPANDNQRSVLDKCIYYSLYVIFHTLVMLLVMEMNAIMVLFVILGVGAGYYYTLTQKTETCCCH